MIVAMLFLIEGQDGQVGDVGEIALFEHPLHTRALIADVVGMLGEPVVSATVFGEVGALKTPRSRDVWDPTKHTYQNGLMHLCSALNAKFVGPSFEFHAQLLESLEWYRPPASGEHSEHVTAVASGDSQSRDVPQ